MRPTQRKMWGITIEGTRGVVGINRLQRMQLATVTLERLSAQWTGCQFCSLLGLWSAVLQLRRPGYAVLASCFTVFPPDNLDEFKHLPLTAQTELLLLCFLAPLLETHVRAPICDFLRATDASEVSRGMCRVRIPLDAKVNLYERFKNTVRTRRNKIKNYLDVICIVGLPWSILVASAFRVPEHINILEARALLGYVRLCIRERRTSQRLLVVIDSGVVKGAVRKFRSSSHGLNFVLRQLAGLSLAYDLYIELLWVPTWANPGDAPSRCAVLEDWRKKATLAEATTFESMLQDNRYTKAAINNKLLCNQWS